MHNVINQFHSNFGRVKAIGGLYDALSGLTTPIIDASDLLRAQIVMAVSALDYYVHEVTKLGMIEVFNGTRTPTVAFQRFQVSMDSVINNVTNISTGTGWFESEIREKHSYLSFQQPDKIADAIRLFSQVSLWPSVATELSMTVDEVKTRLRLIIQRRNKIVHEADMDPSYPGTLWPISKSDASNAVLFIEALCEAIHSVVV